MDKENRNEPFNHKIPITMKQKLTHSYTLQNGARRRRGTNQGNENRNKKKIKKNKNKNKNRSFCLVLEILGSSTTQQCICHYAGLHNDFTGTNYRT